MATNDASITGCSRKNRHRHRLQHHRTRDSMNTIRSTSTSTSASASSSSSFSMASPSLSDNDPYYITTSRNTTNNARIQKDDDDNEEEEEGSSDQGDDSENKGSVLINDPTARNQKQPSPRCYGYRRRTPQDDPNDNDNDNEKQDTNKDTNKDTNTNTNTNEDDDDDHDDNNNNTRRIQNDTNAAMLLPPPTREMTLKLFMLRTHNPPRVVLPEYGALDDRQQPRVEPRHTTTTMECSRKARSPHPQCGGNPRPSSFGATHKYENSLDTNAAAVGRHAIPRVVSPPSSSIEDPIALLTDGTPVYRSMPYYCSSSPLCATRDAPHHTTTTDTEHDDEIILPRETTMIIPETLTTRRPLVDPSHDAQDEETTTTTAEVIIQHDDAYYYYKEAEGINNNSNKSGETTARTCTAMIPMQSRKTPIHDDAKVGEYDEYYHGSNDNGNEDGVIVTAASIDAVTSLLVNSENDSEKQDQNNSNDFYCDAENNNRNAAASTTITSSTTRCATGPATNLEKNYNNNNTDYYYSENVMTNISTSTPTREVTSSPMNNDGDRRGDASDGGCGNGNKERVWRRNNSNEDTSNNDEEPPKGSKKRSQNQHSRKRQRKNGVGNTRDENVQESLGDDATTTNAGASSEPSSCKQDHDTTGSTKIRFKDIIGHQSVKLRLDEVLLPIALPMNLSRTILKGVRSLPASILMYGPPGCGKTQLAKAVAGESRASFLSIGPSDILSKFVGESEASIRSVFVEAACLARRNKNKCTVLFFDEIDALGQTRGSSCGSSMRGKILPGATGLEQSGSAGDTSSRRLLAELLIQLTKVNASHGSFQLSALDSAENGDEHGDGVDGNGIAPDIDVAENINTRHCLQHNSEDDENVVVDSDELTFFCSNGTTKTTEGERGYDVERQHRKSKGQMEDDHNSTSVRVIVIAATNRPEDCDPALLRRFAVQVNVGLPTNRDRKKILRRNMEEIDHTITNKQYSDLAAITDGWSGSELESLAREAVMAPVRECIRSAALMKRRRLSTSYTGDQKQQCGRRLSPEQQQKKKKTNTGQSQNLNDKNQNSGNIKQSKNEIVNEDDDDNDRLDQSRKYLLDEFRNLRAVGMGDYKKALYFIFLKRYPDVHDSPLQSFGWIDECQDENNASAGVFLREHYDSSSDEDSDI